MKKNSKNPYRDLYEFYDRTYSVIPIMEGYIESNQEDLEEIEGEVISSY